MTRLIRKGKWSGGGDRQIRPLLAFCKAEGKESPDQEAESDHCTGRILGVLTGIYNSSLTDVGKRESILLEGGELWQTARDSSKG